MVRGSMRRSYDTIGINYSDLRKPDARIEAVIGKALGSAETVLNVGAGAGSYEPADRQVTAVEPSAEMIRQRGASAAPVIQGYAEDLPFDDNSFDASMAILTAHHWADKEKGLKEMRRVARRSEEHTSELQALMRPSYAVFCFKKKKTKKHEVFKVRHHKNKIKTIQKQHITETNKNKIKNTNNIIE